MITKELQRAAWAAHVECFTKNPRWDIGGDEDMRFLALGLCGEAGELANILKKHWRGHTSRLNLQEVIDEMADILLYLLMLSSNLRADTYTLENSAVRKLRAFCTKMDIDYNTIAAPFFNEAERQKAFSPHRFNPECVKYGCQMQGRKL